MDLKMEFILLRKDVQELRQAIASQEEKNTNLMAMARYNIIIETIRKWDLHFSGDGDDQDFNAFLNKVEKNRKLVNLEHDDLLPHLSMFFTGTASIWYQTFHMEWKTWADFVEAAELWYHTNRTFWKPLVEQHEIRAQGPQERVRDYLIHATALFSKQGPDAAKGKDYQLDVMYRNLRLDIKEYLRRDQFDSVEKLLELATNAEHFIEFEDRLQLLPDSPCCLLQRDEAKPKVDANVQTAPSPAKTKQGSPTPKTSKQTSKQTSKKNSKQNSKQNSTSIDDETFELDILYDYMQPYFKERVRREDIDCMVTFLEMILKVEDDLESEGCPEGNDHSKVAPTLIRTKKDQVNLLYKHLVPHIKKRVRQDEVHTVVDLMVMIMKAVMDIALEKKLLKDSNSKGDSAKKQNGMNSANSKQGNGVSRRLSNGRPH